MAYLWFKKMIQSVLEEILNSTLKEGIFFINKKTKITNVDNKNKWRMTIQNATSG